VVIIDVLDVIDVVKGVDLVDVLDGVGMGVVNVASSALFDVVAGEASIVALVSGRWTSSIGEAVLVKIEMILVLEAGAVLEVVLKVTSLTSGLRLDGPK
jgi:hypothetical protein